LLGGHEFKSRKSNDDLKKERAMIFQLICWPKKMLQKKENYIQNKAQQDLNTQPSMWGQNSLTTWASTT
jgi:hypothetical protein